MIISCKCHKWSIHVTISIILNPYKWNYIGVFVSLTLYHSTTIHSLGKYAFQMIVSDVYLISNENLINYSTQSGPFDWRGLSMESTDLKLKYHGCIWYEMVNTIELRNVCECLRVQALSTKHSESMRYK